MYRVEQIIILSTIKNNPEEVMEVVIIQCDHSNTNVWIPSKLTDYLRCEFASSSLNTKLKNARAVVGFMNYIIMEIELGEDEVFKPLREKGLYGLEFIHLARYINYVSNRSKVSNSYDTVKSKENMLIKFYFFLGERQITDKCARVKSKIVDINKKSYGKSKTKGKLVYISPFEDKSKYVIHYPKSNKIKRILKDLEQDVWEQLIEFAEKYYPLIAFGVTIQTMGGVRQGEVVNLTIKDAKLYKEKNCMVLWIEDKYYLFKNRGIKLRKSQVKKRDPRDQVIYNWNNRLFEIWKRHLKLISSKSNAIARELGALFVDANGYPMSGDSYERYFREMKEKFIEKVETVSPALAQELKVHKWGSHIGRHVFTNYLLKNGQVDDVEGNPNPELLRIARGDENIATASDYIDVSNLYKGASSSINKLSKIAKEKGKQK